MYLWRLCAYIYVNGAQRVLIKLFIVCVGDSKGGDQENRRSERKRGREACGAPFQQRFVSPSKSNSVYEKAAEGVIPSKRMLVRRYSSKGGGQENRFFDERED